MYDRILVAMDGSTHAEQALQAAIDFVKKTNGPTHVTVIHVNPSVHLVSELGVTVDIDQLIADEGKHVVEPVMEKLRSEGISCDSIYEKGDPAREICKAVKRGKYDLLIMGSRGLNNFSEVVLGGVSHKVIQHADCPVMIVK